MQGDDEVGVGRQNWSMMTEERDDDKGGGGGMTEQEDTDRATG